MRVSKCPKVSHAPALGDLSVELDDKVSMVREVACGEISRVAPSTAASFFRVTVLTCLIRMREEKKRKDLT